MTTRNGKNSGKDVEIGEGKNHHAEMGNEKNDGKNNEKTPEEKATASFTLGPQHPAILEPEKLVLQIDGETVISARLNLGYMHRGVEELMQRRNYKQNIVIAEHVCGICSGIHTLSYCSMAENLLGVEIPERAKYIRTIIAELERIHSHMLWAGVAAYEIGFDMLFHSVWRDRELVMDVLESITGNRVNHGMNTIGGVRRDVPKSRHDEILKALGKLEKRAGYYAKVFTKDSMIKKRTVNVGILRKTDAVKLMATGPLARASGVRRDVRKESPYAAYGLVDWDVHVEKGCDVASRAVVRISELKECAKIISSCLKHMPEGELKVKVPPIVPEAEAVFRGEAPRGEIFYYGISRGGLNPYRVKIKTPTYSNALSLSTMLAGAKLADVPIIVASIDPCFCCTDRVTVIDYSTGKTKTVGKNELVNRSGSNGIF